MSRAGGILGKESNRFSLKMEISIGYLHLFQSFFRQYFFILEEIDLRGHHKRWLALKPKIQGESLYLITRNTGSLAPRNPARVPGIACTIQPNMCFHN